MGSFMAQSTPDDNMRGNLTALEKKLAYSFRDITFLKTALTHRSYVNEHPSANAADNERYEFLGDAVLGFCVSDMIIRKYPDFSEGTLSKMRAAVVNEKPLAEIASRLGIGDCLLLGKGEEISGGRTKESLLANALEAVIAAVYFDSGLTKTKMLLKNLIGPLLQDASLHSQYLDYKTSLQVLCQKKYKTAPAYRVVSASGPDHARTFAVEVIAGEVVMSGSGRSKKEAEKQAAQKAWEYLHDEKK